MRAPVLKASYMSICLNMQVLSFCYELLENGPSQKSNYLNNSKKETRWKSVL